MISAQTDEFNRQRCISSCKYWIKNMNPEGFKCKNYFPNSPMGFCEICMDWLGIENNRSVRLCKRSK